MSEDIKKSEEQIILRAVYKDGTVRVEINSKHTPSLSYVHKLIGVEIDKLIIDEQFRARAKEHKIITPGRGGIINFMRGKHGG